MSQGDQQRRVPYWPTLLDIIEAGLSGESERVRAYAGLLAELLQKDGNVSHAAQLQRSLGREPGTGNTIYPAAIPADGVETITLPSYEIRLFAELLQSVSDHFGQLVYEDFELARFLPNIEQRRILMRNFHAYNGDPEVFEDDELAGAEYRYINTSALLGYLAHLIAPNIGRVVDAAGRE